MEKYLMHEYQVEFLLKKSGKKVKTLKKREIIA